MKNEILNSEPNTALNTACVKSRFFVGRRLFQHYGNGMRFDTIVKNEKYHIELAGEGRITKKDATNRWNA